MGGRPHSCWIFEGQDLKQRFILLLEHRNSSGQEGKGAKLGLCVMCTFQGTPTPVSVFPLQGPEHPNPGKPFTARGFPRQCYLPDNAQGRKVLELLKVAWKRRLIFTVGTSSTTGETDTVVWNEIHHKTEMDRNVTGHGYPDPNYLQNVLAELAAQGVTEDCLEQ